MKWPRNLPDLRTELKNLWDEMVLHPTAPEVHQDRLEGLINCLTEIIVDEMRNR